MSRAKNVEITPTHIYNKLLEVETKLDLQCNRTSVCETKIKSLESNQGSIFGGIIALLTGIVILFLTPKA